MNSPKARPSGRCNAWRPARPPRRHAALCAAILACVGGSAALAQQGPQLTVNYREADIRMVTEQVQAVIGRPIIIDPRVRAQVTVLSNAADVAGRLLSNVLIDARGTRIRGARLRQRHPDRARCERALRRRRRLRDASHRPRQHRRRPTRTDLAALAAAVCASRRTSAVECIDRGRSAAEHAPHARPHPAYGSSRHTGSRGHRARERSGRRRSANARPAEPSARRPPAAHRRYKSYPTRAPTACCSRAPAPSACRCGH